MNMQITKAPVAAKPPFNELEHLKQALAKATNNKARTQYRDLIWRLEKAQAAKVAS